MPMYLDVAEVAKLLHVPENQVYHWINENHLPAIEVRGKYCFNWSDLLEWATVRKIDISPEVLREQFGLSDQISLVAALKRGGIAYDLRATNKESALRSVVDALALPPQFDRNSLFDLFLARERLGSTAMGDGIAIPHPRHPVILPTPGPVLALCFLAEPISYAEKDSRTHRPLPKDKRMVNTLFVTISPTIRVHLHVLANLSRALKDEAFRAALLRRGTPDELLSALAALEPSAEPPVEVPLADGQPVGE
jgi:PTS system nitrogen regulatory IIA component